MSEAPLVRSLWYADFNGYYYMRVRTHADEEEAGQREREPAEDIVESGRYESTTRNDANGKRARLSAGKGWEWDNEFTRTLAKR